MGLRYDDYQKVLKNEHFHRQIQSTMLAGQTALMMDMSSTLNHLHGEMDAIRQLNLEGLAIQQEMLQREQLQGQLEEFIYQTQKMVENFSDGACDLPHSARYFSLRGIKETVQQLGIGTALIRGRENKAAFESSLESVDGLLGQLKTHPDVIEALEWVKAEQQRLAEVKRVNDEQKRQHEAQKRQHEAQLTAQRQQLVEEINRLKATRQTQGFSQWYSHKFRAYLKKEPPYDNLPILSSLSEPLYTVVASVILWGPMPFGVLYGCVWIPIWYSMTKKNIEEEMNATVNSEIAKLEQQLAALH